MREQGDVGVAKVGAAGKKAALSNMAVSMEETSESQTRSPVLMSAQ
jgi:hypothetical protein